MGEQVAHEVNPATLPGRAQHTRNGGLQSFMGVRDHQLHTTQATTGQLAQEFGPERLGLGWANIHAKDFSPAVTVDADRDNDGDGDDTASLPHLYISGVQPDIGPVAFQRTGQEGLNSLVDLAAQAADLALGDATHTHGLNQIIDGTCRNALDIGFLDHRGQRLFGHQTRFEEARKIASLSQLRNAEFDGSGPGLPVAIPVTVAVIEPIGSAGWYL